MKIATIVATLLLCATNVPGQVSPDSEQPMLTADELAKLPALIAGRQEVVKAYNAYIKALNPWRADVLKYAEATLKSHGCTKVVDVPQGTAACVEGAYAGWGFNYDSLQLVYNKAAEKPKAEKK
jgi:hypothetical protein